MPIGPAGDVRVVPVFYDIKQRHAGSFCHQPAAEQELHAPFRHGDLRQASTAGSREWLRLKPFRFEIASIGKQDFKFNHETIVA